MMARVQAPIADLLRIVGRRFNEDRCAQIASSLTYTTLLAIVPIITVALTLVSAFPGFGALIDQLESFIMQNMLPASADAITAYTEKFSQNAARLTAVGIAFLAITALLLMLTIDAAFNEIWRVQQPRPLLHRILVYWTVLTIGPLLIGASLSVTSYVLSLSFGVVKEVPGLQWALLRIVPVVLTTLALSLLYYAVPNRRILKRDALAGGITAGAGFEVMKQGFGLYVTHFPGYTLVYGAFAAIPIFLLWVYLSWLVVIGGAVLVAVLPEWRERAGQAKPVPGSDFFDALQVLNVLWRAHRTGDVVTLSELHPVVKVRVDHLESLLSALVGATWVARAGTGGWVMSRDATMIKVADVHRLFVFNSEARSPARQADQELEALIYEISARLSELLQMPLETLFKHAEVHSDANAGGLAADPPARAAPA